MTTTTSQNTSPGLNDLVGSVARVTGATSGIGRATAYALAAGGARVLVHGRNQDRGEQVVAAIRSAGGDAEVVLGELGDPLAFRSLARRAVELGYGHVDILVNNASLFPIGGLTLATPVDDIDAAFAVNVRTPFLLVAELAPAMAARGHGAIVNVLSTAGELGIAGLGLYGATKARPGPADPIMGRRVRPIRGPGERHQPRPHQHTRDRYDHGIHRADRRSSTSGAGRCPDEIAAAISYLAGPGASFVQGAVLAVDGGRTAV